MNHNKHGALEMFRALPDEIWTVVGNHMQAGDLQVARLVSKRWRDLLRASSLRLRIEPNALAIAKDALPLRAVRARMTTREKRQPPLCLQPPRDLMLIKKVFPGVSKVSVRLLSRHGERGEGLNARTDRVTELFEGLRHSVGATVPVSAHGDLAPMDGQHSQHHIMDGDVHRSHHHHDGGGRDERGQGPGGLELFVVMDIDVPRSRHKEAYEAARKLAHVTTQSLSRLGPMLRSLRLVWYDTRLAQISDLASCFGALTGLKQLVLSRMPGSLLPGLATLSGLTSLCIAAVGDELHMQDLGVPRHTEISVLCDLARLSELHLDGWVCEVTLLQVLVGLTGLKSLQLGDDLATAAQSLPVCVLTRLTALTLPSGISLSVPDHTSLHSTSQPPTTSPPDSEPLHPSTTHTISNPAVGGSRSRQALQLALPRLERLCSAPPLARIHDGRQTPSDLTVGQSAPTSVQGSDQHVQGLGPTVPGAGIGQGAARRRSRTPSLITPALRDLTVDLITLPHIQSVSDLDIGSLATLTRLHARVTAVCPDDAEVLQPLLQTAAQGLLPALKDLEVQTQRPQVHPASLLSHAAVAQAMSAAAEVGALAHLTKLSVTRLWEGLAPEGWDYTTKGALGGGPLQRFTPSGMSPRKHLSFLVSMTSLTSLNLHVDRVRLGLLPPSLTSLVLEGVVKIDGATAQQTIIGAGAAARHTLSSSTTPWGSQCPRLQHLTIMLAKHPRNRPTHVSQSTPAPSGPSPSAPFQTRNNILPTPHPPATTPGATRTTTSTATTTPAPRSTTPLPAQLKAERGAYCVLSAMHPVLAPCLTHLSFSATPSPAAQYPDMLTPADYGVDIISQALPELVCLGMYVMPKHAYFIDCRQLAPLSSLQRLRTLDLENPLTGATRLVSLTSLSALTQITQLTTGRYDDESYGGRVCLTGCSVSQRRTALDWIQILMSSRFGALPMTAPVTSTVDQTLNGGGGGGGPSGERRSSRSMSPALALAGGAGTSGGTAGVGGGLAADVQEGVGEPDMGGVASGEEDEVNALLGSDELVHSEDLLYESGEGEEVECSSEEIPWSDDDDDDHDYDDGDDGADESVCV